MREMILYPATMADADFLLELRNDLATIQHSLRRSPVRREEHLVWLETTLASADQRLYIAVYGGQRIGTGRLNFSDDGTAIEVSLTVAPEARGHGIATQILAMLMMEMRRFDPQVQTACVRADNVASLIAFLKAGFVPITNQIIEMERECPRQS